MVPGYLKKSFYSSLVFFGTGITICLVYASISSTWTSPNILEVGAGSGLTATSWNKLLANFNNLDSRSAKAWVNFDATSCTTICTIRSSYNVSSVTKLSVGQYRITFASPLANASYSAIFQGNRGTTTPETTSYGYAFEPSAYNLSSTSVDVAYSSSSSQFSDVALGFVQVFGN